MQRIELPMISTQPRVASHGTLKGILGSELVMMALALSCAACGSPAVLSAFRTQQQAQQHCPSDAVVWVDPQSSTYQLEGHGSYGLSGTGRYACRAEAERAGIHAMAN
jgi:hypothetical protein